MSEKLGSKEENEPEQREEKPKTAEEKELARERAKAAFEQRSKKSSDAIYYWVVIGGFVVMCLACVFYVFKEWRESPNLVAAVNLDDIERHNALKGVSFQRGPNSLFEVQDMP